VKKNIAILLAAGVAAVKAASTNVVTLSTTAVATATGATNAVRKPVVDVGQQTFFQQYGTLLVWVVVIGALFAFMWSKGYLVKIRNFVEETVEELRKCTWPSVDELKGSTLVVMLTIAILGAYTVGVDWILSAIMRLITTA
jgi:preprotein translocase subunit SecE